ncbi:AAA family ATPase [Phaeobacter inhibens]|uniref:AAA family ATPase n=1 Tax=Phaeobacter inhibens TaxID=221822 RepID=UPI0021A35BBD|nr:AAA family ATPase [Phaeobacter inhibens]UWR53664.1 AAA family ATPase [Phaeobacter inhibens]
MGASHNQRPLEVLNVTVLFGKVETILGWIAEGRTLSQTRDRIGPGLHILKGDWWDHVGDVPRRSINTVLVDDDRIEKVLDDMRWFYGASDWYAERGVPWRRGYLFYGPPGTGKSSLIRALASDQSLDIASLDIGRATLTDDDLREAMMCAPKGSLIAIEDVDAVFTQREGGEKRSGVSFSGLLNAIDGVAAQEGRALVMTTNHKEKLDPALIRPGRADVHTELGLVAAAIARRLFERFFPGERDLAGVFEERLGHQKHSPAQIQGWLLANSADPETAALAWELDSLKQDFAAE